MVGSKKLQCYKDRKISTPKSHGPAGNGQLPGCTLPQRYGGVYKNQGSHLGQGLLTLVDRSLYVGICWTLPGCSSKKLTPEILKLESWQPSVPPLTTITIMFGSYYKALKL